MKLTVFGGTGRTGQVLVRKALERGHRVTVLARNPGKLALAHPDLTLVQGDVKDPEAVERAVGEADAVLSVLGPASNKPVMEISAGMENIVQAMKHRGLRRLVITAGAGVGDPNDAPKPFDRFMGLALRLAAAHVRADMVRTVEIVRSSGLDWTVVRVPMLTDGEGTGMVRTGCVGKGTGPRLARHDLAEFLLKQAEDGTRVHEAPAISN